MGKHLITEEEFVICPICADGKHYKLLDKSHLSVHKKSLDDIRKEYPNVPTCCASVNRKAQESRIKKLQEKYPHIPGIVNVSQIKEIANKVQNTKKSDPDHYLKRAEKIKQTNLKKYGKEWIFQTEEFINDLKEKMSNKSEEEKLDIIKKIKKTKLEEYGNENYTNRDKANQTNNVLYGGNAPTCSKEVIEKRQNNNMKKYGVKETLELQEVINKRNETNINKYGGISPLCNPDVINTRNENSLNKYGETHHMKTIEYKTMFKERELNKFLPKLYEELKKKNLEIVEKTYCGAHITHTFKCLVCGEIFETIWNSVQQYYSCPKCFPRNQGFSKHEEELRKVIQDLGFEIKCNSRDLISPLEIDIVIESQKTCIEYNGLYYHTEKMKQVKCLENPIFYHSYKVDECYKKGYKLITIFEDEWINKKDIVISRLKHILGKSESKRIHARECEIKEIDSKTKDEFLDKFHIQGKDISPVRIGAFYDNRLISVMTFSHGSLSKGIKNKSELIWELSRFCSHDQYIIPGIASRLLEHFKKTYEWQKIFTYADRRWSSGDLYLKLGFSGDFKPRLNYWYCKDGQRIHRFKLRKTQNDPKDVTEKILRLSQGYSIIWDCGNYKFEMIR
jgi:G:T-mismatch repair DNA endonuclease (very short patch repair protein)/DNA-directed RNA polymerase subunit RPC12/RpoP